MRGEERLEAGGQAAPHRGTDASPHWPSLHSIHSSWDCGLFANYSAPWQVVSEVVALRLPPAGQRAVDYLGSHAFRFPLLILLRFLSGQRGPREGK